MAIPEYLLPHDVSIVRPSVSVDAYNNEVLDYDSPESVTPIRAWLQQDVRDRAGSLPNIDGRDSDEQVWFMATNDVGAVRARDHVVWNGPVGEVTFRVEGVPEPAYTPRGLHHAEITLRVYNG